MRLTIALLVTLAASLWGNFAAIDRTPELVPHVPVAKGAEAPAQDSPSALIESSSPAIPRAEELRRIGLDREQLIAVINPGVTREYRDRLARHQFRDLKSLFNEHVNARHERDKVLGKLFGDVDDNHDVYRPGRTDISFDFDPPEDDSAKLVRREIGRRADTPRVSEKLPADEAGAIHRILSQVGGVALDRAAKVKLIAIARENWDAPDQFAAALNDSFDPSIAQQLRRSFEPGYRKAYQHATVLSDDISERVEIAARRYQLDQSRQP